MIGYTRELYFKDATRELKGGFSIQLPDDKSPEEVRQYLDICIEAAMKSVKSYDIEPDAIEVGNKMPQLPAPPAESTFKKNTKVKPPSEKQLIIAQKICTEQGISPKDAAKRYGVSTLEDLTGRQIWEFINENKKYRSDGSF